jgi:hypothetical protein
MMGRAKTLMEIRAVTSAEPEAVVPNRDQHTRGKGGQEEASPCLPERRLAPIVVRQREREPGSMLFAIGSAYQILRGEYRPRFKTKQITNVNN